MNLPRLAIIFAMTPTVLALPSNAAAALPEPVDFNYHVKPLLSDRCFACHGPDEKARKAKLRLDTSEGAFKALEGGMFVLKPHDPAHSEVIRRITSNDPEEKMPPPDSNLSLNKEEIELLRRWVQQGADWKKHWAFLPLRDVGVPAGQNKKWPRNDLDRFILARLEQEGLRPAPEASRDRWLRRVCFDLTGLPPTLAEIDAFLADQSPNAYERVVDRLLAAPAYGERMAVDWLDVARYADTYGYQADRFNHLWPWRDWVISAFNHNLPFDDFILWQIAGDLLPQATRKQRVATAFNRNHRQTNEGGSVDEEFRVEYNADRVQTTAGAFLGLTMECARCHDHKYDPITQKDYYRFFAFFNSTEESGLYSHFTDAIPSPTVLLYANDAQEQNHQKLKQLIITKEDQLRKRRAETHAAFEAWRQEQKTTPPAGESIAHYSFDEITNRVPNLLGTNHPAKLNDAPARVPGRFGQALKFSGENSATIEKFANFKRTDPFSFSLWIQIPEIQPEIVVLHHQQAGSDAGYQGYQLVLEEGHASFSLIHFWPGNAVCIRTREKLKLHEWLHLGITYDGSSRAAGLKIFLNGQAAPTEVVKDQLFKDFANNQPLTMAARFRGRGFKNGQIDELQVFDRGLTELEMQSVFRSVPLAASNAPAPLEALPSSALPESQWFEYYLAAIDEPSAKLRAELKTLRDDENRLVNGIEEIMGMGDLPAPRPTYVLKRGAYDAPGDRVEPGTPEGIFPLDPALPRNRLGLARWLIDPRNPLTARFTVNRYWQMFFGRGLVVTAENFGSQGALPSHPELLDWLAQYFIKSGWDLKALQKLIVTSAAYRQSSQASPKLLARDPDNQLLARGPKNRLTAEMLRDGALAASGLLVTKIGGPSVKPFQPEGVWEETAGSKYEADKGENLHRRSLYTFWKRTAPHPMMTTFDAAERNNCLVRRQTTSTPLQALVLLNDPQFTEAAQRIGERAMTEGGSRPADRILFTFRLLVGRKPSRQELAVLGRLYEEQLALFGSEKKADQAPDPKSKGPADGSQNSAEAFAYAEVAAAILNFDEAVTKR